MFRKLNHVGIVVKNLEEAGKMCVDILGLEPWEAGTLELKGPKGIRIKLFRIGNNSIELIEPVGTRSRAYRQLKEKGEGLFHLSIFTDDFDAEVKALREKGYEVEEETKPMMGYNTKLAFLPPEKTKGVWIELVDSASIHPAFSGRK
jgi:methylmalonyl-CoA/ethylmalonyl-CoA epimerase